MKRFLLLVSLMMCSVLGYSQAAQLQVIHNSPDNELSVANIFVVYQPAAGGEFVILYDNVDFQTATPFVSVESGVDITIYFAPMGFLSHDDAVFSQNIGPLTDGEHYVAIANGILTTSTGYTPAPPLSITVLTDPRLSASNPANTDLLFFNGCTDAPTLDLTLHDGTTLADDISYEEASADYIEFPAAPTILDIRNQAGALTYLSFAFPLDQMDLDGESGFLFLSGFGEPDDNNGGPFVGLFYVSSQGGPFVELPQYVPVSLLQIAHAAADNLLTTVDIYVDVDGDVEKLEDVEFLTSTEFMEVLSNVALTIYVAPANSTVIAEAFYSKQIGPLDEFVAYEAILAGIAPASTGYSLSPAFDIYIYEAVREEANVATNVDVLVFNGVTDAPAIDINDQGSGNLVDDLSYGAYSNYLEFPFEDYVIDITNAAGTSTIATYDVPFTTSNLEGLSAIIVAAGFVTPSVNNNGAPFGLYIIDFDGGPFYPLQAVVTNTKNQLSDAEMNVFPIPAAEIVTVALQGSGTAQILSAQGEVLISASVNSGNNTLDVASLKPGIYSLRVTSADRVGVRKIVITK